MFKEVLDFEQYINTTIDAIAGGQVLLKNDAVLPIKKGSTVSVFGRMQNNYYKSGTGSGGMVNVNKVYSIMDGLYDEVKAGCEIKVNDELAQIYLDWEKEHPYVQGQGWGEEPWSQAEMPLDEDTVRLAESKSDIAIVIIGRTAGEDQDNRAEEGSYLLTADEKDMLKKVRNTFDKMVVVLNVGNIIDMKYILEINPEAVLYAWQGGMLGGLGTAKVLTGTKNPSGHLTDTIAYDIEDYPSTRYFGDPVTVDYVEDIFVGYRYFETFAKDRVIYPFGYGLTYTTFDVETMNIQVLDSSMKIEIDVTNVGDREGREVVEVYVSAPQGKLGKPNKVLVGFAKTKELKAGEKERLNIKVDFKDFASFDETGVCGLGTGFVLEKGNYGVYVGTDVRNATLKKEFILETDRMLEELKNALGPVKAFKRMINKDGKIGYEDAPLRKDTQKERRLKELPENLTLTGDKGYKLIDVKNGNITIEEFVSQLSEKELCAIIRNEGMCSPQVTPGTAAAFGGIVTSLKDKGIPIGCMDDGPSGMRLDSGKKAFSLPNGTLMACTFDTELNEKLFGYLGLEMIGNKVDVLLGPGMNIHRNPLNGRNFEYFSEDPFLTGSIGKAQIKGLQSRHVTGTIKHFACNNQEVGRQQVDPVVSERALREIYLKGFEMAVKAGADSVMTTYCQVNGVWTAGCYDLNTTILRNQWGFKGIVMTDWWANISEEGSERSKTNFAAMIRSQNDLYACTPDGYTDIGDNLSEELANGKLTIGELQRSAINICNFLMKYDVFDRLQGEGLKVEVLNAEDVEEKLPTDISFEYVGNDGAISLSDVKVMKGTKHFFGARVDEPGTYHITFEGKGREGNEIAQIPIVLFVGREPALSFMYRGDGEWTTQEGNINLPLKENILGLYFGINGVDLGNITFKKI